VGRTPLQLYLRRPHQLYRSDIAPPGAWEPARDGGSTYLVAPVEDALLVLLGLDRVPADARARRGLVGGPNNMLRVRSTKLFPGFDPVIVQRLSGEVSGRISGDRIDWTFGSGVRVVPGAAEGALTVTPSPGAVDIAGWAVDDGTGRPADWILVFSGDRLVAVTALGAGSAAARDARGPGAERAGFAMRVTGDVAPGDLRFVAVTGDRAGDLEPAAP